MYTDAVYVEKLHTRKARQDRHKLHPTLVLVSREEWGSGSIVDTMVIKLTSIVSCTEVFTSKCISAILEQI